jgi:hypothetical protein
VSNFTNPSDNSTYYLPPIGANPTGPNSGEEVSGAGDLYVPASCTVSALRVRSEHVNSGYLDSDQSTFTVRHNGSNTAMTCTVNNPTDATVGGSATCSDTSHTFTVTAGDLIEFLFTQTNGANAYLNYSTELVCQ